jgi:hypothetical protein
MTSHSSPGARHSSGAILTSPVFWGGACPEAQPRDLDQTLRCAQGRRRRRGHDPKLIATHDPSTREDAGTSPYEWGGEYDRATGVARSQQRTRSRILGNGSAVLNPASPLSENRIIRKSIRGRPMRASVRKSENPKIGLPTATVVGNAQMRKSESPTESRPPNIFRYFNGRGSGVLNPASSLSENRIIGKSVRGRPMRRRLSEMRICGNCLPHGRLAF